MANILVVDDEVDINNLIRSELVAEGHSVFQAFDGEAALLIVEEHQLHLVILDWMLPKLDGLTVCRRIRQNHLVPIIMLTARTQEVDRVLGLEVGADDYVSKPFSIREVTARVRAMLRRVELDRGLAGIQIQKRSGMEAERMVAGSRQVEQPGDIPAGPPPIIRGPLQINIAERVVSLESVEIDLTPKEYDLIVLLATHPGRAFSREFLLQQLWGYDYDGFDRTVDTHITRLRKKLGTLGEKIVTVWGVGYRFVV
jgi:DNA-binding response OmpR family regulator